jgi:hypothetical protein
MLVAKPGTEIEIPLIYREGFNYVDPDDYITVFLKRGYSVPGPVIIGPVKYSVETLSSEFSTQPIIDPNVIMVKNSTGYYTLKVTLPQNLFDGIYTVEVTSIVNGLLISKETNVQCKGGYTSYNESYDVGDKFIEIGNRARYSSIGQSTTMTTVLIGHTDAINPYGILKINSMQEAVNVLRADIDSPLLRGVFDAYSCGARDIYIMSAGFMSEYVEDVNERNVSLFADDSATPNVHTFYSLYYRRLSQCYKLLRDYEFLSIIVPLEASIINTENVNFVKQLSDHCEYMQTETGEVIMGVIGSKNGGVNISDINELYEKDFNINSEVDNDGFVISDSGKYVVLVYGEAVFSHNQFQRSYVSSMAAATAAMLSSTRLDRGLTRARIPGALSIHGVDINAAQVKRLQEKGINTIIRGQRSRRAALFDIMLTSDYTQSISESFKDSVNVRLVSVIINEIQSLGNVAVGKFGYDKIIKYVEEYMSLLQQSRLIINYKVDSYADRYKKGVLYFNINITSSRTLRSISFNVTTGKDS